MVQPPTPRQRSYLSAQGIAPPPTNEHCRRLMRYLRGDTNCPGKASPSRVQRIVALQQNWIGKKVLICSGALRGVDGRVTFLGLPMPPLLKAKIRRTAGQLSLKFRSAGSETLTDLGVIAGVQGEHEAFYELPLSILRKLE